MWINELELDLELERWKVISSRQQILSLLGESKLVPRAFFYKQGLEAFLIRPRMPDQQYIIKTCSQLKLQKDALSQEQAHIAYRQIWTQQSPTPKEFS